MINESRYADHVTGLQSHYENILNDLALDGLVLESGPNQYYYEDDQTVAFRSNGYFRQWLPLNGPNHFLIVRPGCKPKLLFFRPDDFWHDHEALGSQFWLQQFDVMVYSDQSEAWSLLRPQGKAVYHGTMAAVAEQNGFIKPPASLLPRMEWLRGVKSQYEIDALTTANEIGARGHKAAEQAFLDGKSELDIHFAYLQAVGQLERQLPYETIIALNEKGAILHYPNKRSDVTQGKVLLIDAGANCLGYASDITRTYATEQAHPVFRQMLKELEVAQQKLCQQVTAGMTFGDLNWQAHLAVGQILIDAGVIRPSLDAEAAVEKKLTAKFFPHGLGHLLGIFVHELGGHLKNQLGEVGEPSEKFPKLRLTRTLAAGTVVTIEPGIYFIEMLLGPTRQGKEADLVNWSLVDELVPCGGIRIEDNVAIGVDGQAINLTRRYLP